MALWAAMILWFVRNVRSLAFHFNWNDLIQVLQFFDLAPDMQFAYVVIDFVALEMLIR
jgi:hypothetical protein